MSEIWEISTFTDWEDDEEPAEKTEEKVTSEKEPREHGAWMKNKRSVSRREWLTLLNAAEKVSKIKSEKHHYINNMNVTDDFDKVILVEWRE